MKTTHSRVSKQQWLTRTLQLLIHTMAKPVVEQFPLFLTFFLLIAYPCFRFLMNHHEHVSSFFGISRYVGVAVFIAYLFTLLVHVTKSKVLKVVFYLIPLVLAATDIFLYLTFGKYISPQVMILIEETNSKETSEFLKAFVWKTENIYIIAACIVMIGSIVWMEMNRERIAGHIRRWNTVCKTIAAILLIYFMITGIWKMRIYYTLLTHPTRMELERWATSNETGQCTDLITCSIYAWKGFSALAEDNKEAVKTARKVYDTQTQITEDSTLTVVYVLGESFIKHHSSLYGYQAETNPLLKKEQQQGNLYVFNDVVTPYNQTSFTVKNTFSCNRMAEKQSWADHPFFPTIYKRSGYHVAFWDIQRGYQEYQMFSLSLNSLLFGKDMVQYSYDDINDEQAFQYDEQLIDNYFSKYPTPKNQSLVMFHLLGQHVAFEERYPQNSKFNVFTANDIKRNDSYLTEEMKWQIAFYDNATRYNDYVLAKIIERYRDRNCILVYYSDHGEEVYDYRPSMGRKITPMSANLLKYQFDIPFMIWCSDRYKASHPEMVKNMAKAINKPILIDHVAHAMLAIGGIKTEYYRADMDFLNDAYRPMKRIVNDNIDYDKIMKENR